MILVTGAMGFLGSEIVRRLAARGDRVRGVDVVPPGGPIPAGVEMRQGDLTDPAVAREAVAGVDRVIHSAAVQHHTPGCPKFRVDAFMRRNVTMTRNLLDAAKLAGVERFVFVSTDMVYGPNEGTLMRENADRRPVGPYGQSKVACEDLCVASRGKMRVTIARPSVILGPGRFGILVKLFDQIRSGRPVLMIGTGANRHHMIEVGDCAAACILALDAGLDESFNIGTREPTPTRKMLAEVCRRAGSRSRLVGLPAGLTQLGLSILYSVRLSPMNPEQFKIAPVDYVLDTSAARERLGFEPKHTDTDALFATYRHYLSTLGAA